MLPEDEDAAPAVDDVNDEDAADEDDDEDEEADTDQPIVLEEVAADADAPKVDDEATDDAAPLDEVADDEPTLEELTLLESAPTDADVARADVAAWEVAPVVPVAPDETMPAPAEDEDAVLVWLADVELTGEDTLDPALAARGTHRPSMQVPSPHSAEDVHRGPQAPSA